MVTTTRKSSKMYNDWLCTLAASITLLSPIWEAFLNVNILRNALKTFQIALKFKLNLFKTLFTCLPKAFINNHCCIFDCMEGFLILVGLHRGLVPIWPDIKTTDIKFPSWIFLFYNLDKHIKYFLINKHYLFDIFLLNKAE